VNKEKKFPINKRKASLRMGRNFSFREMYEGEGMYYKVNEPSQESVGKFKPNCLGSFWGAK